MEDIGNLREQLAKYQSRELELEQHLEELKDFINNASTPLHWVDSEGVITWANQAELDSLGYTAEEYIGRHIGDFHADEEVIKDILNRLNNNETIRNYPARLKCKDNSIKHVLINSNVLFKDGKFMHTRCFTRDITELKREEERKSELLRRLEHSETRMNLLMQSINLGTWDFNPATRGLDLSDECRRIYGLPDDLAVDFELFKHHIHPDDKDLVLQEIYKSLADRESDRFDLTFRIVRFDDKSVRWVKSQGKVYRTANQETESLIGTIVDITTSKTAEEALIRQRKQLYSIFMQAPIGIGIFLGPEYVVDLINAPMCDLYGKTMEEFTGKPIFDVLRHAKGLGFEELLDKVRLTGMPFQGRALKMPVYRKGQLETAYVNFIYEPFRETDGTIIGVIAIAIEVTEQVRATHELQEAEQRARLAIDAVGLGTFDVNLETGETVTSAIFAKIFGFENPVPSGEYIKVIHPDDLVIRTKAYENAIKTGKLFYEVRLIWPDKSIRWVRVEGKFFYEKGKAIRLLGTLLDITLQMEIKLEQQELVKLVADRERLLRNITSATPTGLWMADAKGDFTYLNQTWIDWTGLPCEEQTGSGWVNTILPEDRQQTTDKFHSYLIERCFHDLEFRFLHVDGNIHWVAASGKPQFSHDGKFTGYIGAFVDITEQKKLQQQKDEFIGIASHELKTPITSIKAYTQILERMLMKSGNVNDAGMMRKMDAQINRLTSLIGDLLDVTKINTGKLQFNDRYFDFDELLAELMEDLQRTAGQHTLIANASPVGLVYGDRERISQVIINLVTNAVKYSPQSDRVIIDVTLKDGELNFSVQDFGIGIASKNLTKVFDQFYRVSGDMQNTFQGLGLGLYISAEIIRREGGKIWVTSKEGEGSTFYFSLPVSA